MCHHQYATTMLALNYIGLTVYNLVISSQSIATAPVATWGIELRPINIKYVLLRCPVAMRTLWGQPIKANLFNDMDLWCVHILSPSLKHNDKHCFQMNLLPRLTAQSSIRILYKVGDSNSIYRHTLVTGKSLKSDTSIS